MASGNPEKKAWRLIFAKGLLEPFFDFDEVISIRRFLPGSNDFTKGEIIEGHFLDGYGLKLVVLDDTVELPFKDIHQDVLDVWGQAVRQTTTHEEMVEQMRSFYPDLSMDDRAALIRCRLYRVDGSTVSCPIPDGLL